VSSVFLRLLEIYLPFKLYVCNATIIVLAAYCVMCEGNGLYLLEKATILCVCINHPRDTVTAIPCSQLVLFRVWGAQEYFAPLFFFRLLGWKIKREKKRRRGKGYLQHTASASIHFHIISGFCRCGLWNQKSRWVSELYVCVWRKKIERKLFAKFVFSLPAVHFTQPFACTTIYRDNSFFEIWEEKRYKIENEV